MPVMVQEKDPDLYPTTTPTLCSCIRTLREMGVLLPPGVDAKDLSPNGGIRVGNVVLMKYTTLSHVALIEGFDDTTIWVVEGNYKHCELTRRLISRSDPRIIGYWSPADEIARREAIVSKRE